ncbi:MAG: HD domain-containing phosphohydrolase [Lachnospiraceae bacterium]
MNYRDNIINRDLIIGWSAIVAILFIAYVGEIIKGERTWLYLIVFMIFTALPQIISTVLYIKSPSSYNLRYVIVCGYFLMYAFVMITGSTSMVFTYVFPMLSLIILYHQPKIILWMGVVSFIINIIFIIIRVFQNEITINNSKEIEIQLALILLCFSGSYAAAKLYDSITKENYEYIQMLNEKSEEIKKMTFQSITTIANTIDAKDEYTKGHSQRVSEYSYALAKELGLSDKDAENIRAIALLHDIGKIGVPDSVLNKPGKLTDEEYAIMKMHPIVGSEILKDIHIVEGLDIGAKYHHERYDGKGYPAGLSGSNIPFIARIICIADSYDAMSSNRIYRKRFSDEKILEELEKCKGTQFDPEIADAFIKLIEHKKLESLSPDMAETEQTDTSLHEEIVKYQAEKNILYEFKNHQQIEHEILQELSKSDGCMLLIDIDNIDDINKKYGYHRGDYYISIVAETLIHYDDHILVSRIGGDEFLCFIPDISSLIEAEKIVVSLMNKLNTAVAKYERSNKVTLSAGVSLSVISGREYSKMCSDADKALYHIKQQGKNNFYIYSDVPHTESKDITKHDLDNLVKIIQSEYSYQGAFKLDYREFEKIYEFVRNVGKRNAQTIQLILFTIKPENGRNFTVGDRINAMQYLENAIINTVRRVDVTTRYSSTQQFVMFMNLNDDFIQNVVDRITKEFYRMYDKKNIVLTYDIANLAGPEQEQTE